MLLLRQLRYFTTSRVLFRPALSSDYKSKDLWEERFNCGLLGGDQNMIKLINNKIISDSPLTNLEVDVFINIAAPRKRDLSQIQEAVSTLRKFRKSLHAHTLLPSTSHAICRLLVDSDLLPSLMMLLEKRIEYGIFPDPIILNIMFDRLLELEHYAYASRVAALIMLQEEFGMNAINDNFAIYSVAKYVESQTDFFNWIQDSVASDPILNPESDEQATGGQAQSKEGTASQEQDGDKKGEEEEEEEEEEDAEYIRIPFLRNPYNDNHFDLTDPRKICGKTLTLASYQQAAGPLAAKCLLLGEILSNSPDTSEALTSCMQYKVDKKFIETAKFYADQSLASRLDKLPLGGLSLSEEAEQQFAHLKDLEKSDIETLRENLKLWSNQRFAIQKARQDHELRMKQIEEIREKKKELKQREEYLYYFDNLKKRNLSRISYD